MAGSGYSLVVPGRPVGIRMYENSCISLIIGKNKTDFLSKGDAFRGPSIRYSGFEAA